MPKLTIYDAVLSKLRVDKGRIVVDLSFPAKALERSGATINDLVKLLNNDSDIRMEQTQQELPLKDEKKPENAKPLLHEVDVDRLKLDGDIGLAVGGVDVNKCKVTKIFNHNDMMYVAYAMQTDKKVGSIRVEAYQLLEKKDFSGETFKSLDIKDKMSKKDRRPYHRGLIVTYVRRKFVLGAPVVFCSKKPTKTIPSKRTSASTSL